MNLNVKPCFRAPEAFDGKLNHNEVFNAIYNMIISQEVFSDNVKGLYDSLVQRYKVDGTLYGDTKLFYATDCLASQEWTGDNEAANLLALNRPDAPKVQSVTIDQFRMIPLTVDNYLTKRAFADEGTFSAFNGVMKGWMAETKKIYESKLFNVYVGNLKTEEIEDAETGEVYAQEFNTLEVPFVDRSGVTAFTEIEAANRLDASSITEAISNLSDNMKDAEREYNSYGFMRSYDPSDLVVVFNAEYANRIKYVDLPTIFHKEGLEPIIQEKLPAKYFGHAVTEDNIGEGKEIAANGDVAKAKAVYSKVEKVFTFGGKKVHLFPGDALAVGMTIDIEGVIGTPDFEEDEVYVVDKTIIGKILHKRSIPFMSAFEVGTSFWNARSLTENLYSIWGYSELTYLLNYPVIEIKVAEAVE